LKNLKTYFILLTAILIALLYFIASLYRTSSNEFNLKLSEIPDRDFIAPFDFDVHKDLKKLQSEQEEAAKDVKPVYMVSENLKFNSQKNLDYIFQHFNNEESFEKIKANFLNKDYDFSDDCIKYLMDTPKRQIVYEFLSNEISAILDIGIYPDALYLNDPIKIEKFGRITPYRLKSRYSLQEAKNKLLETLSKKRDNPIEAKIVSKMSDYVLIPNIIINEDMTKLEREKAREKIPTIMGKVQKNEVIVEQGHKVTSIELLKLQSLMKATQNYSATKNKYQMIQSIFGVFIFSLVLLVLFNFILTALFHEKYSTTSRLLVILGSFLLTIIFTIAVHNVLQVSSLLIPFSFAVLLVAVIFNVHIGIIFNFFSLFFVSLFLNWSFVNPLILSLGTLGGILALKKIKNNQEYYPQAFYLIASFFVIISLISLIKLDSFSIYSRHLIWGIGSCILSIVGFILFSPIIEHKLNMATKQILLELLDFDNPLMQKVAKIAPGTYHHSIIVGNLAESAAEAIGANHLLARVGSYYHDIGKIENPQFFIENGTDNENPHDKMIASESAHVIKKHINDGIALAKKINLPEAILQFIRQHHGTSLIRYFYNKAIESNLKINETDFQYSGPKPQTKETAIVMIADIVESTTKSLDVINEEIIKEVLEKTVKNLMDEKQLDEAPITLREINIVKSQMMPILLGVYRKRLEYPEPNTD